MQDALKDQEINLSCLRLLRFGLLRDLFSYGSIASVDENDDYFTIISGSLSTSKEAVIYIKKLCFLRLNFKF